MCCSGTSASALAAKSAAAAALPPPWEPFKPDPEVEALIDEGAVAPVTGMALSWRVSSFPRLPR